MTAAESKSGKRVRILESKRKVSQEITGTVIRAKQEPMGGQPWVGKGKMPELTVEVWTLDIKCADPLR